MVRMVGIDPGAMWESDTLYINAIVYSEVSIGFKRGGELGYALTEAAFKFLRFPKKPCFWRKSILATSPTRRHQDVAFGWLLCRRPWRGGRT